MKVFKHQHWHVFLLVALLYLIYSISNSDASFQKGSLYGISTSAWFIMALLSAVMHQFYVLLCWRSELYYQSISTLFGKQGFTVFKAGFALLILSRPVSIFVLAVSNAHTISVHKIYIYVLTILFLIPSLYLFYSVRKYFGLDRAFGKDHFYPEEFKNGEMVRGGIFKYSTNAMYVFGFLILWIPGILFQSKAAIAAAIFHHLYIWLHYYFTELPDIKEIYG